MRFTGQVKIPDLDYPGVPAEVLVDDKQTELFVEGESLGRWSLVDVRAERLIANAFSLRLDDEEITFIADQPTEFAYAGVEHMANVWARHKSIRLPVRFIANNRSRRGTKPSRIGALREAIEEALSGTNLNALSGRVEAAPVLHRPVSPPPEQQAPEVARHGDDDRSPGSRYRPAEPPTRRPAPPEIPEEAESETHHDPVPTAPDTPDSVFAEPDPEPDRPGPPVSDSIYKDSVPWARSEQDIAESPPDQGGEGDERDPGAAASAVEPEQESEPEPEGATELESPPQPATASPEAPPPASVPWIAPPAPEPGTPREVSDVIPEPPQRDRYVVDLGAFEEPDGETGLPAEPEEDVPEEVPSLEPVMTGSARGGIMGAVRSAFVRNTRTEHEHEYVEAPGGLGIKRQICAECGHISIGVSE